MPKINRIDFIDLDISKNLNIKIQKKISDLISSKKFIGGEYVENFEDSFSSFLNSKYCLGVANGTDALEIAIEALNLPENAEIIVPNFTFLSPAEAVIRSGYKLKLADVNEEDCCIDVNSIKKLISDKTAAIILVHLFGFSCDMNEIFKIAKEFNLKLIEDCSQAHGAKFGKNFLGTFGDIGTFSFYPTKNLGAFGDAGAMIFKNSSLRTKSKQIANHGRVGTYDHILPGRNSRLDSIQALVLREKLNFLKETNEKRRSLANYLIKNIDQKKISLVNPLRDSYPVFHQFPIFVKNRDSFKQYLSSKNIQSGIYYPKPLSSMKAFKSDKVVEFHDFKSKRLSRAILSLPMGPHLTKDHMDYLLNAVKSFQN